MRIALVGASGRMGRAIIRLAAAEGATLACAVGTGEIGRDAGELAGTAPLGVSITDSLAAVERARADVVIDFSVPAATLALAPLAAASKIALVSGTTGLAAGARAALDRAAVATAVLWEPNMSVGVYILSQLVARAAAALADWDVEIVETHHRRKEDAPSGTALRLAEVIKGAWAGIVRYAWPGGVRPAAVEIAPDALRAGEMPRAIMSCICSASASASSSRITRRAATTAQAPARLLDGRGLAATASMTSPNADLPERAPRDPYREETTWRGGGEEGQPPSLLSSLCHLSLVKTSVSSPVIESAARSRARSRMEDARLRAWNRSSPMQSKAKPQCRPRRLLQR